MAGQNRRLVLSELSHPYGVTVLDQYIYWTDWDTKSLQRADKNTALDRLTVRSGLSNLMDVKAWKVFSPEAAKISTRMWLLILSELENE